MLEKFLITNNNYEAILAKNELLYRHNIRKIYLRDSALDLRILERFLKLKDIEIFINFVESGKDFRQIHLKGNQLHLARSLKQNGKILSYSAHSMQEILEAFRLDIDYIFISPIFAVRGKNEPLGVEFLEQIPREIRSRIFALGGIQQSNVAIFEKLGIKGIAGIRIFSAIFDLNQKLS